MTPDNADHRKERMERLRLAAAEATTGHDLLTIFVRARCVRADRLAELPGAGQGDNEDIHRCCIEAMVIEVASARRLYALRDSELGLLEHLENTDILSAVEAAVQGSPFSVGPEDGSQRYKKRG